MATEISLEQIGGILYWHQQRRSIIEIAGRSKAIDITNISSDWLKKLMSLSSYT